MAKKFKFKFENVLKIKILQEEKIKAELGRLYAKRNDIEREIEFIKSQEIFVIDEFKKLKSGTAQDFKDYQNTLSNLKKNYENKQNELDNLDRKIEDTKEILIEAMKERKVLEALKDKKREEFKKEENKLIQKIMDEIGLTRRDTLDA